MASQNPIEHPPHYPSQSHRMLYIYIYTMIVTPSFWIHYNYYYNYYYIYSNYIIIYIHYLFIMGILTPKHGEIIIPQYVNIYMQRNIAL